METRPDILVLGGGGVAGINWLTGVLAAIEDRSGFAFADCEYFVGTSAGSIVAARLAAGEPLARPSDVVAAGQPGEPTNAFVSWATALAAPLASVGLRLSVRPGAAARAVGLRLAPTIAEPLGRVEAGGGIEWDGRLRVVTVERRSGKRVVFGSPGAPDATVLQAVRASCTVPWLFAPELIGRVEYVDGGVWSPTNLDSAPARRDTRVLCLCPTGSSHGPLPLPLRAASRMASLVEASALKARGADVQLVVPDRGSAAAMGRNLMADEPATRIHATGYRQGLSL